MIDGSVSLSLAAPRTSLSLSLSYLSKLAILPILSLVSLQSLVVD